MQCLVDVTKRYMDAAGSVAGWSSTRLSPPPWPARDPAVHPVITPDYARLAEPLEVALAAAAVQPPPPPVPPALPTPAIDAGGSGGSTVTPGGGSSSSSTRSWLEGQLGLVSAPAWLRGRVSNPRVLAVLLGRGPPPPTTTTPDMHANRGTGKEAAAGEQAPSLPPPSSHPYPFAAAGDAAIGIKLPRRLYTLLGKSDMVPDVYLTPRFSPQALFWRGRTYTVLANAAMPPAAALMEWSALLLRLSVEMSEVMAKVSARTALLYRTASMTAGMRWHRGMVPGAGGRAHLTAWIVSECKEYGWLGKHHHGLPTTVVVGRSWLA